MVSKLEDSEMERDFNGEDRRGKTHWSLDFRVPIALMLAFFLQAVVVVWNIGALTSQFKYSILANTTRITQVELSMIEKTTDRFTGADARSMKDVFNVKLETLTKDVIRLSAAIENTAIRMEKGQTRLENKIDTVISSLARGKNSGE